MSDPYSRLLRGLAPQQSDASLTLRLGQVAGISPLSIEMAGLTLTEGLWVNPELLEQPRQAEFSLPGETLTGSLTVKKPLQAGDRVVLLSDGDQVFYVLCKVVTP